MKNENLIREKLEQIKKQMYENLNKLKKEMLEEDISKEGVYQERYLKHRKAFKRSIRSTQDRKYWLLK